MKRFDEWEEDECKLSNVDDWEDDMSVKKIGEPREEILLGKKTAKGFRYIF